MHFTSVGSWRCGAGLVALGATCDGTTASLAGLRGRATTTNILKAQLTPGIDTPIPDNLTATVSENLTLTFSPPPELFYE